MSVYRGEQIGHRRLLPEAIDSYVSEDNPVRVVDAFVDALDLAALGFCGIFPENQLQSSRGLKDYDKLVPGKNGE